MTTTIDFKNADYGFIELIKEIEYSKSFKKAFKKLNESEKKLTKDIIWN